MTQEKYVRERWVWPGIGEPKRSGFDVNLNDWASEGVPWGYANVANTRRPEPHRVEAFANPIIQANAVVAILMTALKERLKDHTAQTDRSLPKPPKMVRPNQARKKNRSLCTNSFNQRFSSYEDSFMKEAQTKIDEMKSEINRYIGDVFPDTKSILTQREEADFDVLNTMPTAFSWGPCNGFRG